ncbi:E3 ubiquitin-protein transferase MAEA [Helicoverpa zea]|uniref:E3 ubiquitin-protein transferase MAEA n=1 Tax=Helicoverpa zea TaxID=7113 RepID=UPI001F58896B|nr:E3 ubiquitin-protein transferase MAEA [Helicoverpa zea]XP_047035931.1 E3 ubiquitin-protein transferase MAEA [Helicoverpa zea]XP_047035932.1 E3 ubiquitin-protein transferase MAEA [Helicoverpa zea]XP_049705166.1 E3 ubiquitin-protein transferase MAEA [Helicoverpa armigera]XP_049705167.1 E3 ubiquitin-protein transferase MAEA [Helicoverpa armigera]XP_049705168.1 E3 ubiquitin-protein transferase MAEA [Helicoverpa armigera]XP_049705169.1 E3 ubiquitin-protein transferase MAEA [Helicoverpa armigera
MNELKSLEHATLKVPYEVFNKRYRNAQRVLDVEARQVGSGAGELDTATRKQPVTTGEIDTLLGGMVEKLTTMKRKASEAITEEVQAAYVCKKRLEHLKEQAAALAEPSTPQVKTTLNQWRKVRLDRMLVDYFLRNGYYESANKLADARGLRDLTNVDIYGAAAEVEAELVSRRTARCLQWCADNKSKLRKLNSNMEFKIRIQEFIELVREDKRLEAVRYAKKHFSTYEEDQLKDIQHCMGMLAFPKDTEVEPYRSLLQTGRWTGLVEQFRWEHARLLHPAKLPSLPVALQLGLAALHTPQCGAARVPACPACQPPLCTLARTLPHAHVSHSRLLCRISRAPLNEHNQPMVLPNGQVYGEKALKEMMKEHGSIICPKTKEVFCMKRVEKVYVM